MSETGHGNGTARATDAPAGAGAWSRRRWLVAAVAVGVAAVLFAAGAAFWSFLERSAEPTADRSELLALDAKLSEVEGTLRPIALSFTSLPATAAIDVGDYRARIAKARDVVGSVNDVTVTSSAALEIRDEILTGGAQVLDGMSSALDALTADDASATAESGAMVEEGLTQLEAAREALRKLLGTSSST